MNIVIVGGGTAGWIASYFILKAQPGKHNITVIESSKLGIIGAGEGSTGSMLDLLSGAYFDAKVDIPTFMKETDSTLKMGIYHKNWAGDNVDYFAPIDATPTWASYTDSIFRHVLANYGRENIHLSTKIGQNFENKNYSRPDAFHFDGHKVGEFFKKICKQDGATIIDSVVDDVELDKLGNVKTLVLDSGKTVTGDLFIDCTGFARILMKKVGVEWKSYSDCLPVNCAMPFLLNYEPGEVPLPVTGATALSSGWMWNIPLTTRRGCGYVFDKNFISREDAQKEVEEYLGRSIKPIKFIEFEGGRSETFWKNNVLALGLASAFVEPLEATSIHSTIIQLLFFVKEYLLGSAEKTITDYNQETYNQKIKKLYDLQIDFISFHYQGGRDDTPFWRSIKEDKKISPLADIYLKRCKDRIPGILETNGIFGSPTAGLWNAIAGGLGIITPEQAQKELEEQGLVEKAELLYNSEFRSKKSYITFN
jgi:tryptophan halogenase